MFLLILLKRRQIKDPVRQGGREDRYRVIINTSGVEVEAIGADPYRVGSA
jgi:hypothetical protein